MNRSAKTLLCTVAAVAAVSFNGGMITSPRTNAAVVLPHTMTTSPSLALLQSNELNHETHFVGTVTGPHTWPSLDPSIVYSTFLGGKRGEYGAIARLDNSGSVIVAGSTTSSDFLAAPSISGFHSGLANAADVFVLKLNPTGDRILSSTYIGGTGDDRLQALVVDSSGDIYVAGSTDSSDFPLMEPLQPTLRGGRDAFITKISGDGSAIDFSTYLGGSENDVANALAITRDGDVLVAGSTKSSDFPVLRPTQWTNKGGTYLGDAFLTQLRAEGDRLVFSTYLGGSRDDAIRAITLAQDDAVVIGMCQAG